MNEKDTVNEISFRYSREYRFDENGNLTVKNLSAYWIPELTIREEIAGTVYSVTGSYEGTASFVRKLERITARKFTEKLGDGYEKE